MLERIGINRWHGKQIGDPVPALLWQRILTELPTLWHLNSAEAEQLQSLVSAFLTHKRFISKGSLELDSWARLIISAQACLPILYLGLDCYRDWRSIIVYPNRFITHHPYQDAYGVIHSGSRTLVGEAWDQGPLVLSWDDVLCSGDGFNVVIHECAHKLDMLNGAINGFPPLPADMDRSLWSRIFNAAYDDFCHRLETRQSTVLDPYAAESPGEFFAVTSEAFFECPQSLQQWYPAVYRQFKAFYRQDPGTVHKRCNHSFTV